LSEGRVGWSRRWLRKRRAGTARARALNAIGTLAWYQRDHAEARRYLEEALSLQRALEDANRTAATLNNLGLVARDQGTWRRLAAIFRKDWNCADRRTTRRASRWRWGIWDAGL